MPLLTPKQQEFQREIRSKIDISEPTIRKLLFGQKCQGSVYRKLKAAGVIIPTNEELFADVGKDRPFDPKDSTEVGRASGLPNGARGGKKNQAKPASLENGGIEVTRIKPPPAQEVAQFTDEEKQEIRDNYRRTSQGLAPLLADGSRPPPTDRPTPGDVEYWAQRAIAIGIAKPRASIPPPTGEAAKPIPVPQPTANLAVVGVDEGYRTLEEIQATQAQAIPQPAVVDFQKLAGKPRPPPPENLAPIRQAAMQRFGKPVEPSSDETGKFLSFNGRVIGMGGTWEEAFDSAEIELASITVNTGMLTESDGEVVKRQRPLAVNEAPSGFAGSSPALSTAPVERAIDRLGEMARQASGVLGHTLGPWYRPDGEEDSRLVASCKTCNAGVDVANPARDGGSNIRGKAYTTICQGN